MDMCFDRHGGTIVSDKNRKPPDPDLTDRDWYRRYWFWLSMKVLLGLLIFCVIIVPILLFYRGRRRERARVLFFVIIFRRGGSSDHSVRRESYGFRS